MKKFFSYLLLFAMFFTFLTLTLTIRQIKPVQADYMRRTPYTNYIHVSGEFESQDTAQVILSYPVCIKEVYVKENAYVNQGQLLFTLDLEKMQSFLAGDVDAQSLSQLSTEDLSQLATQKEALSSVNYMSEKIYASESGIISKLNISNDSLALAGSPLCTISKTDNIVAKFTMSQLDFGKIKIGDPVKLSSVAFSNEEYQGAISNQNAVIHRENTALGSKVVVDVFATIENPNEKVANGLQINGKIQNGPTIYINTLDYKYINQDEEGEFVYVLQHGLAKKVYVETGIETQDRIQVRTPFSEGTIFITGDLQENDKVIIGG